MIVHRGKTDNVATEEEVGGMAAIDVISSMMGDYIMKEGATWLGRH